MVSGRCLILDDIRGMGLIMIKVSEAIINQYDTTEHEMKKTGCFMVVHTTIFIALPCFTDVSTIFIIRILFSWPSPSGLLPELRGAREPRRVGHLRRENWRPWKPWIFMDVSMFYLENFR